MDTPRGQTDQTRTLAFARDHLPTWREKGVIRGEEYDSVAASYQGFTKERHASRRAIDAAFVRGLLELQDVR